MALITCPECGKQVSSQAAACIHCGCPIPSDMGNLIIIGKSAGGINKPIYYFYDQNGNLFGSVLAGETKYFQVDKPITLILGHKRGSFVGSAVKDSQPVHINPTKVTCFQASISSGFFDKEYHLTPMKIPT